ncbi:hypothetical protein [Rhizobium sp. LjRoot254]|uniref:hypothetical protein n=1 Tax=Rhizobium sp. LjRoot254 TaxID=3342297 RepID=UPI003ECE6EDD
MDTAPEFQRLYVGLVKAIVLHAYRVGFELMLPKTPLPDFIEEGTIIIELKELRQTILPAVGDLFSHCYSSPSEHISNLLPRIGLTERPTNGSGPFKGRPSHVSKFLISYEDIADFVVSKQAWSELSLEDLVGAYFEIYL